MLSSSVLPIAQLVQHQNQHVLFQSILSFLLLLNHHFCLSSHSPFHVLSFVIRYHNVIIRASFKLIHVGNLIKLLKIFHLI